MNEHIKVVDSIENYNRIFTALCGSQNYGLATADSDIDTKSIVIPNFRTFLRFQKALSKTYILDNNEHAEVKDVREMGAQLLKQGMNFLEILFTPYVNVNQEYEWFYSELTKLKERIAHYDRHRAVMAMAGMIQQNCYHSLDVGQKEVNCKKLATAYRTSKQMDKYIKDYSYSEVLDMRACRDEILSIKNGELTYDEAFKLAKDICEKSADAIVNYPKMPVDEAIAEEMFDLIESLFRKEYCICALS